MKSFYRRLGISGIIVIIVILAILSVQIVRAITYKKNPVSLQHVVSTALGNQDLVLGSKLKRWVDVLGSPDLVLVCGEQYRITNFYWLNHGIAVRVQKEFKDVNSALQQYIQGILIPTSKQALQICYKDCDAILSDNSKMTDIRFNKLLEAKIFEIELKHITEDDIRQIYNSYDASEHFYSKVPYPFQKVSVKLFCEAPDECRPSYNCKGNINMISIWNGDILSFYKWF